MIVRVEGTPHVGHASVGSVDVGDTRDADTVVVDDSPPSSSAAPVEQGAAIGRYVVLEEVGSGGMGRVLRAYDPKLQREVALKDAGARRVVSASSQRLVAEARAMAKLSHPNVVTVYDVEELAHEDGQRWTLGPVVLVMEYVRGRTLRAWLDERPRTWREIVARYIEAGRGLAAAHAAGLLHRDFKPSNVMVGDDDAIKVTDFGIAKLDVSLSSGDVEASASIEGTLDDPDAPATQTGMVMGSPRWMAPEQHERRPLTVAADQYAFCVALWEALVGAPPFSGTSMSKLLRSKLAGPPPFPKSQVPRRIVDAIRRGLAPDPAARWPSMHALLEQLAFDPAKRRRRVLVGATSLGAIAIAAVSWQLRGGVDAPCTGARDELRGVWDDATRTSARDGVLATGAPYAEHAWTWASAALDEYATTWQDAYTDACEATAIRKEQSTDVMDVRMACLHRAKLELQAIGTALAQADAKTVEQAHVAVGELPPLRRCADVEALRAEVEPPLPEEVEAVEAARVRVAEAKVAVAAGHFDRAEEAIEAAEAALTDIAYEPIRTELAIQRADVLAARGQPDQAETQLREALERTLVHRQWELMFRAATDLMHVVGHRQQRPNEAMRYRELVSALSQDDPLRRAAYHKNVALVLIQQEQFETAEAEVRQAIAIWEQQLGPDDSQVAVARGVLAGALHGQDEFEASEAEYRRVLEIRENMLGPKHPLVLTARGNLAVVLRARGRAADAEAELRRALALEEEVFGPDHVELGRTWSNLAMALEDQQKDAEALEGFRKSASIFERALGPEHPDAVEAAYWLATAYLQQGDPKAAEAEFRRVLPRMETALPPDNPMLPRMRMNFALALEELGRLDASEVELRRAVTSLEAIFGPDHPEVAIAWFNHGATLLRLGRAAEAEARYRQAIEGWDRNAQETAHAAMVRTRLAELLLEQQRVAEALPLAQEAVARLQTAKKDDPERARAAEVLAKITSA